MQEILTSAHVAILFDIIDLFFQGVIMTTATSISVSANIPAELGAMLDKVARAEERSKSYYIKKGLEQLLKNKLEDLQDYQEAEQAYDAFLASGEKGTPFEEVFSNVK